MCIAALTAEEVNYIGSEVLACYLWVLRHTQYKMLHDLVIFEFIPLITHLVLMYITVQVGVTHRYVEILMFQLLKRTCINLVASDKYKKH